MEVSRVTRKQKSGNRTTKIVQSNVKVIHRAANDFQLLVLHPPPPRHAPRVTSYMEKRVRPQIHDKITGGGNQIPIGALQQLTCSCDSLQSHCVEVALSLASYVTSSHLIRYPMFDPLQ